MIKIDKWISIIYQDNIKLINHQIINIEKSQNFLFWGPHGVGKDYLGKYLAKLRLCHNKKNNTPCDACESCKKIEKNLHPDLLIIRPHKAKKTLKKTISISQIKELIHNINRTPIYSFGKVSVLHDVEYFSQDAASCFLKTLEEPPSKSLFILLSSNIINVLPTISSRCQKVYVKPVQKNLIKKFLYDQGLSKKEVEIVAKIASGKIKIALNLINHNQLNAYFNDLVKFLNIASQSLLDKFNFAKEINQEPEKITGLLDKWLIYLRDLLLTHFGLIDHTIVYEEQLYQKLNRKKIYYKKIMQNIDMIIRLKRELNQNINPKLALENLLLNL